MVLDDISTYTVEAKNNVLRRRSIALARLRLPTSALTVTLLLIPLWSKYFILHLYASPSIARTAIMIIERNHWRQPDVRSEFIARIDQQLIWLLFLTYLILMMASILLIWLILLV